MRLVSRADMPGVVEVQWSNGDRAYGRSRLFPLKAYVRRARWYWRTRRQHRGAWSWL